jgi:tetratricopeptide (TPR) repeat protein
MLPDRRNREGGMGSAHGNRRSGISRRWTLVIVLSLVVMAAGTAAARWAWRRFPAQDPSRLEQLYQAWSEFDSGRYDAATALLDRRQSEVAPTPLDWMLRARIAEAQGRPAEALDWLDKIPDDDAIGARAQLKAGQVERARGHASAAEAHYRRALKLDPAQIQAHRELAYLYAVQRRKAECDAEFRALARLMPLDHILAFAWCQNFCRIWDPNEARTTLSQFVAEDPSDRLSRLALAYSFQLINQPDDAEKVLLPLPASDPDARALRARLALDRGDVEAAEELARHGPEGHAELDVIRGEFALHRADPRRAAAYFRSALRSDPDDRDALHGLGLALNALGDRKADEYLDLASRHDRLRRTIQASVTTIRTDPLLFSKLGEMCEAVNRPEEARVWYQLAINLDTLNTRAQRALARLEKKTSEGGTGSGTRSD